MRTFLSFVALTVIILSLASCHNIDQPYQSIIGDYDKISLKPVIEGIDHPVAITHAGDDSGRLFITQQNGKVTIFDGQKLLEQPFLDISDIISCCGEQGLLSIAFHPDYKNNGRLFTNYTDKKGDTVIASYQVSSNPNIVDSNSGKTILQVKQLINIHNGGQLQFGPDGYLYIGMGDGGSAGRGDIGDSGHDPGNYAQNPAELLGKMLRIDINTHSGYQIPGTNPFRGKAGHREEIWAMGLRNPWRFGFDRQTGDLYIADVGESKIEEINFQPSASKGGENYGWSYREGRFCHFNCRETSYTQPVFEYSHAGGCAVIGGYVYRGPLIKHLVGKYLYSDFCTGTIMAAFRNADGIWILQSLINSNHHFSTFGEAENGELYVAGLSGENSVIYQIIGKNINGVRLD